MSPTFLTPVALALFFRVLLRDDLLDVRQRRPRGCFAARPHEHVPRERLVPRFPQQPPRGLGQLGDVEDVYERGGDEGQEHQQAPPGRIAQVDDHEVGQVTATQAEVDRDLEAGHEDASPRGRRDFRDVLWADGEPEADTEADYQAPHENHAERVRRGDDEHANRVEHHRDLHALDRAQLVVHRAARYASRGGHEVETSHRNLLLPAREA
mmetsp:Transcript_11957/g.51487  ORF Transcript_11957/g.51487 Transcript_11957/m.51487 type:complete len:210 (-) Transcript_11957:255-884(-)